jgi:cell division protein FtsW
MANVDLQSDPPVRKKAFGLPIDTFLLVAVGGLLAFGLMMVYSATFDWSYRQFGNASTIFLRQVQWLGLGLVMMTLAARLDYHRWRTLALWLMAATLGALVLVLFIGSPTFGAQRSFFRGSVQPSELAKFTTIIYLAVWLASKGEKIREMGYGIFPFGVIVGLVAGLILLEPDLSAAATIVIVAAVMFFAAGADLFQMGVVSIFASGAAVLVLQFSETGRRRLADYVVGFQDITQASWHVKQAAIAFVNGGLFGRGLGESHQKFGFLPTPHTDSIFAIIGEELGLIGCLFVIALFVFLVWRGFRVVAQAKDEMGALLAAGLVCWVALEALVNVAVMVGVVPFAGNALPFISYGGSNLVMTLTAMGVLLNISRRSEDESIPRKTRSAGAMAHETSDLSRRDGRGRVSRAVRRPNADR